MTVKGDEIASLLVPAERRHRAPQPADTFDRAASDLLSEQTRLLILYWNPSPMAHCRGCDTFFNEQQIKRIAVGWLSKPFCPELGFDESPEMTSQVSQRCCCMVKTQLKRNAALR